MSEPQSERPEAARILLADDEEGIRKVLGISLADSGYEVHTAADGEQALALFRRLNPDIVLTDIKMPGIDGIGLLKRIKAEAPETEVIMITGHGDMALAIESLKHEATDFVTKPIHPEVLEVALKRARERIGMRRQLREHTENLEALVREQSARLVEAERLAAIGQAVEGLTAAVGEIAGDLQGGLRHFNELPCLVAVHSRGLKVVAANRLYRERLGAGLGADSWRAYGGRQGTAGACPAAVTFESGRGQRVQATMRYGDGACFTAMVHTAPIRDSRGELQLVLEIATDVSEIERLRRELETTRDRLITLGMMVGSVSHGIKGVLTGLDGGLYLLERGLKRGDKAEAEEGLAVVKQTAERIRRLVLDVLATAKQRPLEVRRFAAGPFVAALADTFAPRLRRHGIELEIRLDPELPALAGDPQRLTVAMTNLLENAVDACLAGEDGRAHRVVLSAGRRGHDIELAVSDDGVGMDETLRGGLFQPFRSGKGTAGTGLGLFITRQIVEQHGGRIEVDSAPGRGSTFRVLLPPPADA